MLGFSTRRIIGAVFLLSCLSGCATTPSKPVAGATSLPTIASKVANLTLREGLLPVHVDSKKSKIFLQLPAPDAAGWVGEYLYVEGLRTGLGSNPVGLDRGQLGESVLLRFRRVGGRFFVNLPNLRFRALSEDALERRAVAESFAESVLWATDIVAEDPSGSFLVDFSSFIVRDAHGTVRRLADTGQGSFSMDASRSYVDAAACLSFPDNLEFEAMLSFQSKAPGPHVRSTTPLPETVSLVQHHSLIRLPDDGYRPRKFDPREGPFAIDFLDYAAPLDAPLRKRWIVRHRLKKTDPAAASSTAREPIIYYVDSGAPKLIRDALIEGASWWATAFEAAGFEDAFRVEVMPEGLHPLDVRYNVIQWVHRSTRGWSYGGGVIDPRTGEMLKGHVSLGSLRVRQDRLLFEGLLGTDATGSGAADDPLELALARIRQLAAHEVGHTLGLTHNFAASSYDDRASVMDYPAPRVALDAEGAIDASDAYGIGVGSWDSHAIRYAYTEFGSDEEEAAGLAAIVSEGIERGLHFITDHDARPAGAALPAASLWDNGADATVALRELTSVRAQAIKDFGGRNIAEGQPRATLHDVFVTVYLHHRFQLAAAAKAIGGLDYRYAVRGDALPDATPWPAAEQRAALDAVLDCVDVNFLDVPEPVLRLLAPQPFGYESFNREHFSLATAPGFDALGIAATASDLALRAILQPERCARLVDQNRRDAELPSLEETLGVLQKRIFASSPNDERSRRLQEVVQRSLVDAMLDLSSGSTTAAQVRAEVDHALRALLGRIAKGPVASAAHRAALQSDIVRYLDQRVWAPRDGWRAFSAPPGSPIGAGLHFGGGCSSSVSGSD